MTFTLVSQLREQLSQLVREKDEEEKARAREKERLVLEVGISYFKIYLNKYQRQPQEEEKRTRGTVVSNESFKAWKATFDREMTQKKQQEEEERLKGLTPKEREEWKRSQTRLSGKIFMSAFKVVCPPDSISIGRQLFERNKIVEDETLLEEGTVSVDFSQYERTNEEAEEANEGLDFSDSD